MFWKVSGFSQPSTIEAILDQENFTLENLLDDDDLIQECKSLNGRLINFLGQGENVEKMVEYLIQPAPEDADVKRKTKYPFASCEVFCCEMDPIFNTLLENEEYMNKLFSLLDGEGPVDCTAAGYFGRVFSHLLPRRSAQTLEHLQSHKEIISRLVHHIYDTSITEVILRLVGADEQTNVSLSVSHLQWMCETPILDCLLQRLVDPSSHDGQVNAAQVLVAIIRTQPSPLAMKFASPEYMDALLKHAVNQETGQISVPVLNVCIAAMDPRRRIADGFGMLVRPIAGPGEEVEGNLFEPIVNKMAETVPALVHALGENTEQSCQLTPYGILNPPVGVSRLKVTEVLSVLMSSGLDTAQEALITSGALPKCQELFVQYPFNNLLHRNVAVLMAAAVESQSERVLDYLFGENRFLEWLVSVPEEVVVPIVPRKAPPTDTDAPENSKECEKVEENGGIQDGACGSGGDEDGQESTDQILRAGYIGHVTQIANRVATIGQRDEMVQNVLARHEGWVDYTQGVLSLRNSLEDVSQWECGRPMLGFPAPKSEEDGAHDMDMDMPIGIDGTDMYRYSGLVEGDDEDGEDGHGFGPVDGLTVTTTDVSGATAVFARLQMHDNAQDWEGLTSSSSSSSTSSSESSGSSGSGEDSDGEDSGKVKAGGKEGAGENCGVGVGESGAGIEEMDSVRFDSSDEEDEEVSGGKAGKQSSNSRNCLSGELLNSPAQDGTVWTVFGDGDSAFKGGSGGNDRGVDGGVTEEEMGEFSSFQYWRTDILAYDVPEDV